MARLMKALNCCIEWHGNQKRKYTGEPYFHHPIEVATLLEAANMSREVQIAGLLHDVVEDTAITTEAIRSMFGSHVAELVEMVTDVSRPEDGNRKARKLLDLQHLAKASREGKSIKLADLISNSKSIAQHDPDFAKVYMQEKAALLEVLRDGNRTLWAKANTIVSDYFLNSGPSADEIEK